MQIKNQKEIYITFMTFTEFYLHFGSTPWPYFPEYSIPGILKYYVDYNCHQFLYF